MIYEVKVISKTGQDPRGLGLLSEIKRSLGIKNIEKIRAAKVYRLEGISKQEAENFTKIALSEAIDQTFTINRPIVKGAAYTLEVAYKPGVMNPEVASILKSAQDLKLNLKAADSSWQYAFFGEKIDKNEINSIISRLLVNDTVEMIVKKPPKTLQISGTPQKVKTIPTRKLTDEELMALSKDRLFLNLEEMQTIQNYFRKIKRDPTDCEVEILAQTWSEHCVHKTFKADLIVDGRKKEPLIERIKKTANNNKNLIVSAFVDNSGVIDFYDGYAVCGKVETHNSPSAIEPYGGAMTGSGGVFRDILGTGRGARVLASTDIFCFAPPNLNLKLLPQGCLAPDYLFRKVVYGVRDYGNRVGIPTNNGSVHFDLDFRAKPTVAVGSYGIVKKKDAQKTEPKVGDLIITLGGRTGRDGIHGATFSSGEMTDRTISVSGSAVQIGNAIEEKRTIDLILSLSEKGLIRTLTDCGAGGYSSAIGEMAKKTGAQVHLEKVPLKYTNLAPWEIFLSESQERMVIASDPKNLSKVKSQCQIFNVEYAVIGMFDGSKKLRVFYNKKPVAQLSMDFLHNGLPQRQMVAKTKIKKIKEKLPQEPKDLTLVWEKIMAHGNVCSKEPIVRQYDHNVQGTNALHPFGGVNLDSPNDGAVIKPILSKPYGLVISHGLNPGLNRIDPYNGSIWAIAESVANYVAIGGNIKDAALVDNFIWPYPDEESLADLDKSVDACFDTAKILKMPFVSGKDSLSSTYRYPDGKILKIPPVLLISTFGRIPSVEKTASSDFKKVGSTIVLVGKSDFKNLAGTVYFDVTNSKSAYVPKVDLASFPAVLAAITSVIQSGQALACHDISEGGIAVALAEMSFGGGIGAKVDLVGLSKRQDFVLFGETPGTFLVEVENDSVVKKLFSKVPHRIIGKTISGYYIEIGNQKINLAKLKSAWQKPMKEIFP